jgi:hypothetical protein
VTKPNVTLLSLRLACFSLILLVACDFGGDRSLGTVDSAAGSSADASIAAPPQGGTGGGTTIVIEGPPSCDPAAPQTGCAEGQLCAVNLTCGKANAPIRGYCQERPTECPIPSGFELVCGCDGQFHDSSCQAYRDGISIARLSDCAGVACLSNADCERFAESCVDAYGASIKGAACYESVCSCASVQVIL